MDKREPLTKQDIMDLVKQARAIHSRIESENAHFEARMYGMMALIDSLEDKADEVVKQHNRLGNQLDGLERMKMCLRDDEKHHFAFLDIESLEDKRQARLKALRLLLTREISGMDSMTWIDYQPEVSAQN